MATLDFVWKGFNFTVSYDEHYGYPATREDPGEPSWIEITDIKLEGKDANELISDYGWQYEEICKIVESAASDNYEEPDMYYDDY